MRKFLVALLIGLSLISLSLDASAARLGGGSSIGRSMSMPMPKATPVAPKATPSASQHRPSAAPAAGAAAAKSAGLGKKLLMGAAAALGFMALANMLGLGEGFAQFMMVLAVLAVALILFRMFAAKKTAATSPSNQTSAYQHQPIEEPMQKQQVNSVFSDTGMTARKGSAMDEFSEEGSSASSFDVPKEFNQENFLNMSTSYFKMLQKAWDSGDMDNLANYCTDDMFIALTHKRREIKGVNVTEVLSLTPELAGFETTSTEYVASVLFTGKLSENGEQTEVREIWNLVKPIEGKQGWLLAGIQQA